jgi:hypothetical protein
MNHGSLINDIQSRGVIGQPEPTVGMGCTLLSHSDRNAATIHRVFKVGAKIIVETRNDSTKVTAGSAHDGSAEYAYETNPDGVRRFFRRETSGIWREVAKNDNFRWALRGSHGLRIGERETYYDPSF